ncbi:MAG: hypothetical protein COY40_02545, partial [Alphaproteobacteria bacterium CG_4_10_14_0_8_um_filter_53_9]
LGIYKRRADDSAVDNSALVDILGALVLGGGVLDASSAPSSPAPETTAAPEPAAMSDVEVNAELLAEIENDPILHSSLDKDAKEAAPAAATSDVEVNAELLAEIENDPVLHPSRDKDGDEAGASPAPAAVGGPIKPAAAAPDQERRDEERRKGSEERRNAPRRGDDGAGETIRVETARLDKVMNLVGELVLARNTILRRLNDSSVHAMLEQKMNDVEAAQLFSSLESISRVTQDLQMSVLSTRMQPIKKVFDKIPRQVRELKTQLAKEVNLIIEGEMTEVDKSLVEELADPMVHMIRNALDHGLEDPDEREMSGKHREGTLAVRAFYEGNNVVIQVQEDGKGIDPVKIRNIAIKKGIITETVAQAMTDAEAIRLIMAPGFSTAESITSVSGRGVGMDVVNNKISGLQGSIDITSELGVGTCFSIYMPLTLAIVNALIVGSNKEGFAVPIGDISEVIKYNPSTIHRVNEQDVIELRGDSLPLFYLGKITKAGHTLMRQEKVSKRHALAASTVDLSTLNPETDLSLDDLDAAVSLSLPGSVTAPEGMDTKDPTKGFVVVVRDNAGSIGLVVDELLGQEEVVVKPVSDMFEYNKAISGATITGEGKVHMILDVPYMLKNLSGAR